MDEQQRVQVVVAACGVVVALFGMVSKWLTVRADRKSPVDPSEAERRMLDEAWIDRGLEIKQLRRENERLRDEVDRLRAGERATPDDDGDGTA